MRGDESYPGRVALLERDTVDLEQLDWRPCQSPHHGDPYLGFCHEGDAYYRVRILHPCVSLYGQVVERCRKSVEFYIEAAARGALCGTCFKTLQPGAVYEIIEVIGS